jgi:long-chain fatty acid transport protein
VPEKGPPIVDPQNFHDTVSLAGGVEWEVIDGLRLRSGFQYDETPTVDQFRNTRIPDADRYLLAARASYRVTDSIEATLGYLHGFVKEATFQRNRQFYPGTPLLTSYRFRADASAMVNVIGVGLTYRF